jgi:hypothetical protein
MLQYGDSFMVTNGYGLLRNSVLATRWHTGGFMTKVVQRHDGMYVVQYYPADPLQPTIIHAYRSWLDAQNGADDTLATVGHSCNIGCSRWTQTLQDE